MNTILSPSPVVAVHRPVVEKRSGINFDQCFQRFSTPYSLIPLRMNNIYIRGRNSRSHKNSHKLTITYICLSNSQNSGSSGMGHFLTYDY